MRSPIHYIRRSLSAKLSLWIALFALLIFSVSLGFFFVRSLKAVRQEAMNRATQVLDNTVLQINDILDKVETTADNTSWLIMRYLDKPDSMFTFSRSIVASNPFLIGCSISFEPDYFKEKGHYFSIYSYNNAGEITSQQEGNPLYDYFFMEWYLYPKVLGRPVWTEPFIDYDPLDPLSKDLISSYCYPLKDAADNYVGTLSLDLPLDWLSETIESVKPYPHSYCIMIGEGGHFYVHPDESKLFYETIFTQTLNEPDPPLTALGHAMQRGEEGMQQLIFEGVYSYVFYKPIENTGLSVAVVCPESDIFENFKQLRRAALTIAFLGLLLLLIIFARVVNSELKPLKRLAAQTGTIAKGDFGHPLPDDGREDEIGQLSHSFGDMQQSLINYIAELKQTTAAKASIESELRVASDIQMSMLPRVFPPFPERKEIDLFASMTPAKEVGGDLYNFLLLDEHLYFCLGDVSGKGVPASLFMAQATRLFRTLAGEGFEPDAIATRMNAALCEGNDTMMFVTMFIGKADLKTGTMEFCNCGHNPPVLDGKFIQFAHTNRPLGMWDGDPFIGEKPISIRDKMLLIYTDGLNEAMNNEKEQFGNERLLELMADTGALTACQVVEMLKDAVEKHREGAAPNDDLTMLCIKLNY